MHLLRSGVELNVIKSWRGHVSITTTSQYIEIDMAMKREALERSHCPSLHHPAIAPGTPARISSNGSRTCKQRKLMWSSLRLSPSSPT